jgi:hypothetical protein
VGLVGFGGFVFKERVKSAEGDGEMLEDETLNISLPEQELLAAIAIMMTRCPRNTFHTGVVVGEANLGDTRLSQALEALIPHRARYKSGSRRGHLRFRPIHKLLERFAERGLLHTDPYGCWAL